MIIRKPYGFLIKHYKLINLLLLVPMMYITLKFGDISKFFQGYIKAKYSTPETIIAGKYITALTYLILIFLILYNLTLYVLMKSKKKPTFDYIAGSIFYILLLVLTLYFFNTMKAIELRKASDAAVLMARDIALIAVLPNYPLVFLTLLKGIGFNLKTFRIDNNYDLQVTDDDEAEVELKVGADSYAIKRNIVHMLRELKYYVMENKFVFTCLGAVFLVTILTSIYMSIGIYNRKYNINQAFAMDEFTFTVLDSYITDVDYGGRILDSDNYYLVVKVKVLNRSTESVALNGENFRAFRGKNYYFPSFDRSNRFIDIGNYYSGELIPSEKEEIINIAYKIPKKEANKSFQLKILSRTQEKDGKLIPSYQTIKINPKSIIEHRDMNSVKVGKEINLKETTLGNTTYKLESVTFANTYTWDYTNKNGELRKDFIQASQGKTLMIIKDTIKYDESTSYYINSTHDFYTDFATLNYNYTNAGVSKVYNNSLRNVTPSSLKDVQIYEVSSLANNGTNRKLIINIRNVTIPILLD